MKDNTRLYALPPDEEKLKVIHTVAKMNRKVGGKGQIVLGKKLFFHDYKKCLKLES